MLQSQWSMGLTGVHALFSGIQEGLQMELRLTGASSVVPDQAQQRTEAVHGGTDQDTARDEQKVRSSIPAIVSA